MRALTLSLVGAIALIAAATTWFATSATGASQQTDTAIGPEDDTALSADHNLPEVANSAAPSGRTPDGTDETTTGAPPSVYSSQAAKALFDPVCQSDGYVVETCDCLFNRLVSYGGADVTAYVGLVGYDRLDEANEIKTRLGKNLIDAATKIYAEGEYKACAIDAGPGTETGGDERILKTGDPLSERPLTPSEQAARLCPEGTPKIPAEIGFVAAVFENGARLTGPMRQRASLGRALLLEPKCLIMDEPVSNTDTSASLIWDASASSALDFELTVWTPQDGDRVRTFNPGDLISISEDLTVVGVGANQQDWADVSFTRNLAGTNQISISVVKPIPTPFLFLDHLGSRSSYWTYTVIESGASGEIELGEITSVEDGTAKIECTSDVAIDCENPPRVCKIEKVALDTYRLDHSLQTYLNLAETIEAMGGCASPKANPVSGVAAIPNGKGGFDWIITTTRENQGDLILIDPR